MTEHIKAPVSDAQYLCFTFSNGGTLDKHNIPGKPINIGEFHWPISLPIRGCAILGKYLTKFFAI